MKTVLASFVMMLMCAPASAQQVLEELLERHGVTLSSRGFEGAFDDNEEPLLEPTPGSFAAPLAMLTTSTGGDRIAAAFAFGILAGKSAPDVASGELTAAGQSLLQMMVSQDRKTRIVGARVAGRVFAVPFESRIAASAKASAFAEATADRSAGQAGVPQGTIEALYQMWNNDNDTEQLAAMDALGQLRERASLAALAERYNFYRDEKKRALAGGAVEAMARIGDPSSAEFVQRLAADPWSEGKDATALAVAFARERLLKDGSITVLRQAMDDKRRHGQARGYLTELGFPLP